MHVIMVAVHAELCCQQRLRQRWKQAFGMQRNIQLLWWDFC